MKLLRILFLKILIISLLYGCKAQEERIFKAIEKGDINTVRNALDKGLDVNTEDQLQSSLLQLAAIFEQKEIVKLLVEKGAKIDFTHDMGDTSLFYAATGGNIEIVDFLLKNGANINYKTKYGNSILLRTVQSSNCSLSMIKYLLNKGIDIDDRCYRKRTALLWAINFGRNDAVKLLIENGANVNLKDLAGENALLLALQNIKIDTEIIELLIKKTKDLNAISNEGQTALDLAKINYPQSDIVDVLKKHGAKTAAELKAAPTPRSNR